MREVLLLGITVRSSRTGRIPHDRRCAKHGSETAGREAIPPLAAPDLDGAFPEVEVESVWCPDDSRR